MEKTFPLRLKAPKELYELLGAAVAAYLVIGPLIFIAPLLPFRTGMLKTKSELMASVAKRLRVELRRIQAQLGSAPITKEDEELVDRLRKIASVVDELPVWPFDASTLRKFLTAYVVPVATTAAFPLLKALFELTKGRLLW